MKRLIWTLLAVAISTGVYFTIRYGLRPKPIPVLNPTEFTDLEQLGAVTYKRLRQNVRAERLILLGSRGDLADESRVWQGFLKAAAADGEKIVFFSRDPNPPASAASETVVFAEPDADLRTRVLGRVKSRQLVVVQARTEEVTHLVPGAIGREFERLVGHPVLSISILPLALGERERDDLRPPCLATGEDPDGQRRLGCAAQRVARKFARKNLPVDRTWAVAERHGLKEYLLFVHVP